MLLLNRVYLGLFLAYDLFRLVELDIFIGHFLFQFVVFDFELAYLFVIFSEALHLVEDFSEAFLSVTTELFVLIEVVRLSA
jgi:hypothetical protein